MKFEDLAHLVQTRRSIRRYEERPVPEEMILRAIELATWAPNGGNFQPWQYVVITNRDVISRMADAVDASSRLMASWPESEPYREHADRWVKHAGFFRHAPVCIAVLIGGYQSIADKLLEARGQVDPAAKEMAEWRRFGASRIQTIGGGIMTLLLALHQQGLGACWMAGPQQATAPIEEILGVDPAFDFVALVPIGWPAEAREGAPRKPLDEVVRFMR
jgi:nitroreductase